MVEFLRNWVLNIVTVSILIVLLEIMLPSGKTKKLLNLVTGFILITVIITPFTGLLGKGFDLKELRVADTGMMDQKELDADRKSAQAKQSKQIIEVYRRKLIKNIEDAAITVKGVASAKADVVIVEDPEAANFGEVKRVYLSIKPGEPAGEVKPVTRIEKVDIGKGMGDGKPGERIVQSLNKDMRIKVEEKIGSLLGIGGDAIVVGGE